MDKICSTDNVKDLEMQFDIEPEGIPQDATHYFVLDTDEHNYGTTTGWVFNDGTIKRHGDGEKEDPADLFDVDVLIVKRVIAMIVA